MSQSRFLESTAIGFSRALARAMISEETACQPGLLQSLDPRVRVIGLFSLVLAVILSRRLLVVVFLFLLAVVIALLSKVHIFTLAKRVWLVVLLFTGVIAIPALFLTPGEAIAAFAGGSIRITSQGLKTATLLIARVETAATLTTLLVLCTRWVYVLKALRAFRLPPEVVLMLTMTHRYIFLLVETASQMFESRQSRTVGKLKGLEGRMASGTAGVLLSKSIELSNQVYDAMQSRGFRGEARILSEFHMRSLDYAGLFAFLCASSLAIWVGR